MSIAKKLKEYLTEKKIHYSHAQHEKVYTAQEIATVQHVPGKDFIKSILVKADGKSILCVLSANHMIDFDKLKAGIGAKKVELADESEMNALFPNYEIGAMPPFGHLQNLKVYADEHILEDEYIVFNAGTHTDVIKIKREDFMELEQPIVLKFGIHI